MTASEQRLDLDALLGELDAAAIQPGVREDIAVIADEVRALRGELARAHALLDTIAGLPDVLLAQRDRVQAQNPSDPLKRNRAIAYEDAANRIRTILNSRKDT